MVNVRAGMLEIELLAVREIEPGKHLVVVYRELTDDGFIMTAFVTRHMRSWARREQRWLSLIFRIT
ncbi:MAG: hypothetical protein ACYCRH_09265 [Acidiferrobacteraceae bacterium]